MKYSPDKRDLTLGEAGYIAGFIDGEGSISVRRFTKHGRGNYRFRVFVDIGQTDVRPLVMIKELIGGTITLYNRKKLDSRIMGVKPFYTLRISGPCLDRYLPQLLPFMIVKKDQAEAALEMRKLISGYKRLGRRAGLTESEAAERIKLVEFANRK